MCLLSLLKDHSECMRGSVGHQHHRECLAQNCWSLCSAHHVGYRFQQSISDCIYLFSFVSKAESISIAGSYPKCLRSQGWTRLKLEAWNSPSLPCGRQGAKSLRGYSQQGAPEQEAGSEVEKQDSSRHSAMACGHSKQHFNHRIMTPAVL